jgi:DNA-binding MurR/RpiR family transcriptional regulator
MKSPPPIELEAGSPETPSPEDPRPLGSRAPALAFSASAVGKALCAAQEHRSPANRRIADHVLRNPVRSSASSIEDLSSATQVSTATLSRFARAIGFAGYAEFRHALAETLQAVLLPVEKLRDSFARSGPEGALAARGLEATMSNVRTTAEGLSPLVLAEVAARLSKARVVYVLGFGLSAHLAGYLALGLEPFLGKVVNVIAYGGTEVAASKMMRIGADDALVAFSLPRYARDAIHLASFARDRGAHVIGITDSPASPLAKLADSLLLAEASHPVLSSSASAAMLVIEAVVAALMTSDPDNVAHAEALAEAVSGFVVNGAIR